MFNWFRKRRLSAEARKRLLLLAARAEEAIVDTHVENLLDLLDELADEVDLDRGIELYFEMMPMDESRASAVSNRLLSRLGEADSGQRPARVRPGSRETGSRRRRGKRPYRNVFNEPGRGSR